jgi:hypothetical protein
MIEKPGSGKDSFPSSPFLPVTPSQIADKTSSRKLAEKNGSKNDAPL